VYKSFAFFCLFLFWQRNRPIAKRCVPFFEQRTDMKRPLIILLLFITSNAFGQKAKNFDFSIIVFGCFHADTLSLWANGQQIFNKEIAESDESLSITKLSAHQDRDGLWISNGQQKLRLKNLKPLSIEVILNGVKSRKDININLKKGKIVVLDNCAYSDKDGNTVKGLTIGQSKKTLKLD
jgi:hypothetical protein